MPLQTLVWLLVLLVLALLAIVVLRRMSALVNRTRDLEHYQKAVASVDARSGTVIDPLVRELDGARRQALDPSGLAGAIAAAQSELATLAAEMRALATPVALVAATVALVGELDRASRATEMAEHGLNAMTAATRGREMEAQTSIKRGALNLRHAREAITRLAGEVAAVRPVDIAPPPPGAAPVPVIAPYEPPGTEDL